MNEGISNSDLASVSRRSHRVRFGELLTPAAERWRSVLFSGPGTLWIVLLLVMPGAILLVYSFLSRGNFGQVQLPFTLKNYLRIVGYGPLSWTSVYWKVLWRSTLVALTTTAFCTLLAYPLAFFIAAHPPQQRNLLLTLVILPFWTNLVIRTYAWMLILGPEAWPAKVAIALGIHPPQTALYPGAFAVYLGMVNAFLPYMVLPLYTAVERINWSQAEAARDLYAGRFQVFLRVLLPQTVPGLAAGWVLVGVPAFGMFVVPDLLGGSKSALIGNIIQQQFGASIDYPFGAALGFLVAGVTLAVLYLFGRYAGERGLEDLV